MRLLGERWTTPRARPWTKAPGCWASGSRRPCLSRAHHGDRDRFDFPVGLRADNLGFSFSGLKTSLLYKLKAMDGGGQLRDELPHWPPVTRPSSRPLSASSFGPWISTTRQPPS